MKHTASGLSLPVLAFLASCAFGASTPNGIPGLIRHYKFDEGFGTEVSNSAPVDSDRIAITGGPFGSMSLVTVKPYGWRCMGKGRPTEIAPRWIADGRRSGSFAIRSGTTMAALHRMAVTGRELTNGFTFAMWMRPTGETKHGGTGLLFLGDAHTKQSGFHFFHDITPWCPEGQLGFRLAAANPAERLDFRLKDCKPGQWHLVACTLGDGFCRIYADGRTSEVACTNSLIPLMTAPHLKAGQLNELTSEIGGWGGTPYVRVGYNFNREKIEFVDYDEILVFDRALSVAELDSLYDAGKPSVPEADQQKATAAFNDAEAKRMQIEICVPDDSSGYFRIGTPIPVSVALPDDDMFAGAHTVAIVCEQMLGSFRKAESISVRRGGRAELSLEPPVCGVYFVDVTVRGPGGEIVRRLDPSRVVAVTPKAPEGGLTASNPMGLWAIDNDFSYDSPIRRADFHSPFTSWLKSDWRDVAKKQFENRRAITPELRNFVFFGYPTKGEKLSTMTAEKRAQWERYYADVADFLPQVNVFGVEFMSEPDDHRATPDSASESIALAARLIRERHPEVRLFPAGVCPVGLPWTDRMLTDEVASLVDGISYHSYRGNPLMEMNLNDPTKPIRAIFAKHPGRKLEYWNTESGYDYLPRVGRRPMTHEEARRAGYSACVSHGYEMFMTSMPCAPEDEAAAMQVHAVLSELALGFKFYVKCMAPGLKSPPSLQGVAWTALAGQVLNRQTRVSRIPLASLNMACFVVEQDDGSRIAAICGMADEPLNFRLAPDKTYRTMDMLGNFGTVRTDRTGVLSVKAGKNPLYVFDVPEDFAESAMLKVCMPKTMPGNGTLNGIATLVNESGVSISGTLVSIAERGMEISPGDVSVALKPGERLEIPFSVKSVSLRSRAYVVRFEFRQDGKVVAAAAAPFDSNGSKMFIPELEKAPKFDASGDGWEGVREYVCDSLEDVSHGRPNLACLWNPHWAGPNDLSCRLKLGWTEDDAIHFLMKVTDDVVCPCPADGKLPFCYDCLEVFTDTREAGKLGSQRSPGADQTTCCAVDSASAAPSRVDSWTAMGDKSSVSVEAVGRRTDGGYVVQGRIRPAEGSAFRVRAGSRLRLDFTVNDTDAESELRKSAMTFNGTFDNNTRVDLWGKYELESAKKGK